MSRYRIHYAARPYSTHGILAGAVGMDQTVLDVGCNEGYIGAVCHPSNRFYGVDYDEAALALAKRAYADAACMDLNHLTRLPWEMRFDVILFGDVLEHLLDPQAAYRFLIENYLKPGGKVVISLPNIANWAVRLNLLMGRFDYQDTGILDRTHLHFFTFKSALAMFAAPPMRAARVTGGSNVFGWAIRRAPFLKGLLAHTIILELVSTEGAQ